jgi:hypothetical protein
MISRTSRALLTRPSTSVRSLTTLTTPRFRYVTPTTSTFISRAKSTIVERSPLHSVPSKAERVGKPAVDTKKGKVWASAEEAVKDVKPGSLVLSSGKSERSP